MNALQRRVTFAICTIVGLTFLVSAGLTFLITPMAEDLRIGDGAVETMLALPSIASLLVIFVAGRFGDRLGHRRVLLVTGVAFGVGGILLALATDQVVAGIALAVCGGAATAIQIVAFGLLQETVPEGKAHVSAFTTYGAMFPLAFLVLPVITAGMLEVAAWRWVPVMWAIGGAVVVVLAVTLLEGGEDTEPLGEWGTLVLAGVALASVVRVFEELGQGTGTSIRTILGLVLGPVAAVACWWRVRSSDAPGFSLAPIRSAAIRLLLLGVTFVALLSLLTYVTLALEYLYGLTSIQTALAIVPAQIGAMIGAKVLASRAIHRWGPPRAARLAVLVFAVTVLSLAFMRVGTPAWLLVTATTVFSAANMAAITILNTDVMALAPPDATGSVSAFRGAASALGSAVGVLALGSSVISAVDMTRSSSTVTASQIDQLAAGLRFEGVVACLLAAAVWVVLVVGERRVRGSTVVPAGP